MVRSVLATVLLQNAVGLQQQPEAQREGVSGPSWMTLQESRPWGLGLSVDDLEAKAEEDMEAEQKWLKEESAKQMRETLTSNVHRAEMLIDGTSDMEGYAEPLNETEAQDLSDSWLAIPDTDVTFSYSTYCDPIAGCKGSGHKRGLPSFQEMHRNVLASLRAMRFCFSDILIILDSPHVGHDKMGPETPGNVSSHTIVPVETQVGAAKEMQLMGGKTVQTYRVDSGLTTAATATAKSAAELLRDHCPTAVPQWKVKVVDYASKEVQQRALEHYKIPEPLQNTSFFERMYMNTMPMDEVFQAKSKYVYYIDAQKRLYRSNFSRSTPNFIEKAVSLMKSDSRVYLASVMNTFNLEPQRNSYNKFAVIPGSVHASAPVERVRGMLQGWSADQWMSQKRPLRGEAFHPRWNESDEENKRMTLYRMNWDGWGTIVTHHNFLMDTERFKKLFPLDEWETAVEHMWSANMNKKFPDSAVQIYFNETVGVFAGPSEA